jgi:hypothetical protein
MSGNESLRDVVHQLESLIEIVCAIEKRIAVDSGDLTFEQKIINAARYLENGDPLKDALTYDEIETAVKTLADVYTVTGVKMPEAWD